MKYSVLIGIITAVAVLVLSIATSVPLKTIFENWHAVLVVFGSTFAVALVCFPIKSLWDMLIVFFNRILFGSEARLESVIVEIVKISQLIKSNPAALNQASSQAQNPFLKEGLDLISQGGFDEQELELILRKRASTFMIRYDQQAQYFKTLSKFPPAFGLIGTTLGMMGLMQSIGSPDSFKLIGPAMATGLGATLLGITLSNFILIPLAENLTKLNREDEVLRDVVIDGLKMLIKKQHPLMIEEYLRSYQLPTERRKSA